MHERTEAVLLGAMPPNPGIYRIVAKGKWQVPGGRLSASTPIALAFGIDSALRLLLSIALFQALVGFNLMDSERSCNIWGSSGVIVARSVCNWFLSNSYSKRSSMVIQPISLQISSNRFGQPSSSQRFKQPSRKPFGPEEPKVEYFDAFALNHYTIESECFPYA
jgi:hypothetical protein